MHAALVPNASKSNLVALNHRECLLCAHPNSDLSPKRQMDHLSSHRQVGPTSECARFLCCQILSVLPELPLLPALSLHSATDVENGIFRARKTCIFRRAGCTIATAPTVFIRINSISTFIYLLLAFTSIFLLFFPSAHLRLVRAQ